MIDPFRKVYNIATKPGFLCKLIRLQDGFATVLIMNGGEEGETEDIPRNSLCEVSYSHIDNFVDVQRWTADWPFNGRILANGIEILDRPVVNPYIPRHQFWNTRPFGWIGVDMDLPIAFQNDRFKIVSGLSPRFKDEKGEGEFMRDVLGNGWSVFSVSNAPIDCPLGFTKVFFKKVEKKGKKFEVCRDIIEFSVPSILPLIINEPIPLRLIV